MNKIYKPLNEVKNVDPLEGSDIVTIYKSEALFNGQNQIAIEHTGEVYLLRITKQNKLILTK